VIFDMDGLMFDSERIAQAAWQTATLEAGYELSDQVYGRVVGRNLAGVAQELRAAFGEDFPFEAVYRRKQELVEKYIESDGLPLKPGLLELLEELDRLGVRKAIASSSSCEIIERNLRITGLSPEGFDALVGGDEVRIGKPAPEIFLRTAAALDMPPGACLVLEDSNAGIQAAHAAGMIVLMVPDQAPPDEGSRSLAYRVLPSLHAVRELLTA
jgi:HAD superfamily hydrolase (TIGR01509 family)